MKDELTLLEIHEMKQKAENEIMAIVNNLKDAIEMPFTVEVETKHVVTSSGYRFFSPEVSIKIEL